MDRDSAGRILQTHLSEFRGWSYGQLAAEIRATPSHHQCLRATEAKTPEGDAYIVEINAFWDDQPGGNVRVMGDLSCLSPARRGCLFGLLPVFTPDVVDSFIMTPDGAFIGE